MQKNRHVAAALAIDDSEDEGLAEAEERPPLLLAAEAMNAPPRMTLDARTLPLVSLGRVKAFSGGVWSPQRPPHEVFGGPNTYSQGIWKTTVGYKSPQLGLRFCVIHALDVFVWGTYKEGTGKPVISKGL